MALPSGRTSVPCSSRGSHINPNFLGQSHSTPLKYQTSQQAESARLSAIAVPWFEDTREASTDGVMIISSDGFSFVGRLWWSKDTVAVVTGGSKGLGLEIVRQLAKEGLTVVLTARDPEKGQNALKTLEGEGIESVVFHQLDVTSSPSVDALAVWLQKEFGGLDILVNNAGVHFYSESHKDAVETLATNYYGVKRVTRALIPLMKESCAGARIVNISSQAASLKSFTSCLHRKIGNVDCLSEVMLDNLATRYLEEVQTGNFHVKKAGWAINNFQFCESKLLLNTYTQILARSLAFRQPQNHRIFVNAMCPGTCQTDMGAFVVRRATESGQDVLNDVFRGCAIQSVESSAETAVWLALLPRSCYPNGRFFSDRKEITF